MLGDIDKHVRFAPGERHALADGYGAVSGFQWCGLDAGPGTVGVLLEAVDYWSLLLRNGDPPLSSPRV